MLTQHVCTDRSILYLYAGGQIDIIVSYILLQVALTEMLIEAENSEYPAAPVNPYRKLLGLCWQLLTHSKSIFLKVVLT